MQIREVEVGRRYWLIRSGSNSGEFYKHFRQNSVIAIGHAMSVSYDFDDGTELTEENKTNICGSVNRRLRESNSAPSVIGSILGQLRKFLNEIAVGDVIITLNGSERVTSGIITSPVYYDSSALEASSVNENDRVSPCRYNLRMNVDWGKTYRRDLVPYNLDKTLRIPNTIAEFSEISHIRTLNQWLNPVHMLNDEVRCLLRISSDTDIPNRTLTRLSQVFDELDILSSYIEQQVSAGENVSLSGFQSFKELNEGTFSFALTAQHEFMSPGYQFIQLPGGIIKRVAFGGIYISLFSMSNAQTLDNNLPIDEPTCMEFVNYINQQFQIDVLKDKLVASIPSSSQSGDLDDYGVELQDDSPDSDSADTSMA